MTGVQTCALPILATISAFLAFLTFAASSNIYTRVDVDNIAAMLAKNRNHEKCKVVDCMDRGKRVLGVLEEISRIPYDLMHW